MGAEPVFVEPEAHDRAMAYVSHAPQLVASAIYAAAARVGVLTEGGAGFRDVTRIAGGPKAIWQDIVSANRHEIAAALGEILEPLIRMREGLVRDGDEGLSAALELLELALSARNAAAGPARRPREST